MVSTGFSFFQICSHTKAHRKIFFRFIIFLLGPLMPAFILANHVFYSEQVSFFKVESCNFSCQLSFLPTMSSIRNRLVWGVAKPLLGPKKCQPRLPCALPLNFFENCSYQIIETSVVRSLSLNIYLCMFIELGVCKYRAASFWLADKT